MKRQCQEKEKIQHKYTKDHDDKEKWALIHPRSYNVGFGTEKIKFDISKAQGKKRCTITVKDECVLA